MCQTNKSNKGRPHLSIKRCSPSSEDRLGRTGEENAPFHAQSTRGKPWLRTVLLEGKNPTDGNPANESPRSQHARPRRPTPNLQLVPIVNSARLVVPSCPLFAAIVGRHALLRLGDQAHCPRTPDRPGKLSLLLGTDLQRNGVQQSSESRLKPTSSLVCASPPSLAAAPRFLYRAWRQ